MTPDLCRAARALLDWTLVDLSTRANVSVTAINEYERRRRRTQSSTVRVLQLALEDAGIEFYENGEGPGLRLKKPSEITGD